MESRKSSNIIENAKKGAIYGGFFGSGFGMGMGEMKTEFFKMSGRYTKPLTLRHCTVGLVIGALGGAALASTTLGLFGAKNNQQILQPNIIPDKTKDMKP